MSLCSTLKIDNALDCSTNLILLAFEFSDADDCRRICEHGAKKLGYGSYQHYILSNYTLFPDASPNSSDYDSD